MHIDPDMATVLAAARLVTPPDYENIPLDQGRAIFEQMAKGWNAPLPDMAAEDLTIAGRRARILRPRPGTLPVIVYIHGGGWCYGSIDSHHRAMRVLARESGAAVLGIDYRLAPEHPFPAALRDVNAALDFIAIEGVRRGLDPARVALAGDSAGANIALAAMIDARASGRGLRTAALFYGCYAPDLETRSNRDFGGGDFMLTTKRMAWYWRNHLGAEPIDTTSLAAPSRADLAGLPPLYLNAAGLDPLLDDSTILAERLTRAQVEFRLDVFPGVVHGFMQMTSRVAAARRAHQAAGAWLAAAFAGA